MTELQTVASGLLLVLAVTVLAVHFVQLRRVRQRISAERRALQLPFDRVSARERRRVMGVALREGTEPEELGQVRIMALQMQAQRFFFVFFVLQAAWHWPRVVAGSGPVETTLLALFTVVAVVGVIYGERDARLGRAFLRRFPARSCADADQVPQPHRP
ncbi:hypothetical protein [Kineosporia babensis]|uniref:Uncharacterized protein n=1 Tax=Kineosporia babensis TaxID=499548 RepID=A0A9X1NK61_9ACTN|nr:hypothetical protein [Kineosporia babensis]MCD5315196.1 hypothetical protein [Kineosporia babensis]